MHDAPVGGGIQPVLMKISHTQFFFKSKGLDTDWQENEYT
jgi:hypothetical protein